MMLLMGRSPKLMMLLMGVPLAGGIVLHPQSAGAFVMGAWAGVILIVPLLWILLWGLRLRTLPQLIRPMLRWPILLAFGMLTLHLIRTQGMG